MFLPLRSNVQPAVFQSFWVFPWNSENRNTGLELSTLQLCYNEKYRYLQPLVINLQAQGKCLDFSSFRITITLLLISIKYPKKREKKYDKNGTIV